MGAVNLVEDVPRIKKQDFVFARCFHLASVKEPERTRQSDGIEEV